MDKTDPPESFGVFKPVGHILAAFATVSDMEAAALALGDQGFEPLDLVRYSPAEMKAQVDAELLHASPMAAIGQDINLIKVHRKMAEQGCSFLVVHAPSDEQSEQAAVVLRAMKAVTAQSYGRFIVEELIDPLPDVSQVFESSERGLDINPPGDVDRAASRPSPQATLTGSSKPAPPGSQPPSPALPALLSSHSTRTT
jgi:hypothetical protein